MGFSIGKILFLLLIILAMLQSTRVFANEISITDADEMWTLNVTAIANEALDSSDAVFKLSDEVVICHADETWNYEFDAFSGGVTDSTDASFTIPIEAQICHADEIWENLLTSVTTENSEPVLAKIPVLFVPGLLSTEINKGSENLWAKTEIANPFNSDNFLDPLTFNSNLFPGDNSLSIGKVITQKIFGPITYDFSKSLIDEFKNQGYITDDNVDGQDFFTFPYDWRYGVSGIYPSDPGVCDAKTNVTLLRDTINDLAKKSPTGKVDVIAHSMGGLVVKKYIIDNIDPKINKLIFVGVPNLGSPSAVQALLDGSNLGLTGLNPQEFKKISQNLPAAYDLVPSKGYYTAKGSYLTEDIAVQYGLDQIKSLNYEEALLYFNSAGLNRQGILNANSLHSTIFDYFDIRTKGIDTYDFVGCKSNTFRGLIDYENYDIVHNMYGVDNTPLSGDDTVPFESADSILVNNANKFYFQKASHGKMPSADGIRQKIVSVIAGVDYPQYANMVTHDQLVDNPGLCALSGDNIVIKSPVDINVADSSGNVVLGVDTDGNTHYDIPGASFAIANGHKYVYLPSDMGNQYHINLKGAGTGTFTLIDEKIDGDQAKASQVFNDIPVTPGFSGALAIGSAAKIVPASGLVINPTSVIPGNAAQDMLAPKTTATISGQMGKQDFYRGKTTVNLASHDLSQDAVASGVFSITYQLDANATSTVQSATTTIPVGEGRHRLVFWADDKLGNKEIPQTINFTIDNTAPEIKLQFDQTKKDLAFTASDNISAPENIAISDQNGIVTAADEAGNTTQLSFKEKNRVQSLRAQLNGLAYNGQAVDVGGVQLAFAWFYGYTPTMPALTGLQSLPAIPATLPKTGPLSFLLQQAKLKDGAFVTAVYGGKNTLVLEYKNKKLNLQTFSGLKLIKFATTAGSFSWGD
jgi:hypothetical protein